jgi:HK97 gp10 family phage protein
MPKLLEITNPDGFPELLRRMGDALGESAIRTAGAAAASVVLEEAKRRVPVGWIERHQGTKKFPIGFGRDSMLVAYLPEKSVTGRQATYMVTWAKDAFYLRFVEYGTSKMAAQPFFRPAIDATKMAQDYAVIEALNQKIAEAKLG